MSRSFKKIVAVICAIAMVVTGITIQPKSVSAAVTDLPVAGNGVKIEVNNFGQGDVVYVAGLKTITGAISYNLYVDNQLWGAVSDGQNIDLANFKAGEHKFFATGIKDDKEIAKSKDFTLTIPDNGQIDVPDVDDGTEILTGLQFTDEDVTNDESEDKPWFEMGGKYTNHGDGSVSIAIPAYSSGDNWATQLKQNKVQLIRDKWYKATYTVTSDVDKSIQFMVQQNEDWTVFKTETTTVKAGEKKTVEVVFQATQTTDKVLFGFMMGYVDNTASEAAKVTISGVSLKVYNTEPSTVVSSPSEFNVKWADKGENLEFTFSNVDKNAKYNLYIDNEEKPIKENISSGAKFTLGDLGIKMGEKHTFGITAVIDGKESNKKTTPFDVILAPSNFEVKFTEDKTALEFNFRTVAAATEYELYIGKTLKGTINPKDKKLISDLKLEIGKTYKFGVSAKIKGKTDVESEITVKEFKVLPAPLKFNVNLTKDKKNLEFTFDKIESVDSYNVYVDDECKGTIKKSGDSISIDKMKLENGKTYKFGIKSVIDKIESDDIETKEFEILPSPSNFNVKWADKGKNLEFTFSSVDKASQYNLYIDDREEPVKKNIKNGDKLSLDELKINMGEKHTFGITAVFEDGNESVDKEKKEFNVILAPLNLKVKLDKSKTKITFKFDEVEIAEKNYNLYVNDKAYDKKIKNGEEIEIKDLGLKVGVTYTFGISAVKGENESEISNIEFTMLTSKDLVASSISNKEFTGKEITPKFEIKWKDKTLKPDTDYTIVYQNNVKPGKAKIKVTGVNNYDFDLEIPFTIQKTIKLTIIKRNKKKTYVLGTKASYSLPQSNKELAKKYPWLIEKGMEFNGFRARGKKVSKISDSTTFTVNGLNYRKIRYKAKKLVLNKGIFTFKFNGSDKKVVDGVQIRYSMNENLKGKTGTITVSKNKLKKGKYTIKNSKSRFRIGYYYYFEVRYFYKIGKKKYFYNTVTHKAIGYGVKKNRSC